MVSRRHRCIPGQGNFHRFGRVRASNGTDHFLYQRPQRKISDLQLQLAGLDFGKIEDLIDDAQQRAAACGGVLQQIALAGIHPGFLEQLGHAQEAIHRCANFMTNGRQELALAFISCLGGLLCLPQRLRTLAHFDFQFILPATGQPHQYHDRGGKGTAAQQSHSRETVRMPPAKICVRPRRHRPGPAG